MPPRKPKPAPLPLPNPTSIRIPDDIKLALRDEAAHQRRAVSWIIIEIFRQWMAYISKEKISRDMTVPKMPKPEKKA